VVSQPFDWHPKADVKFLSTSLLVELLVETFFVMLGVNFCINHFLFDWLSKAVIYNQSPKKRLVNKSG
jgi:hypothetical protein